MALSIRRGHRIMGAVLVLPFLAWAITGLIFFIKPGYGDAYAQLKPKTYALDLTPPTVGKQWLEYRLVTTVLGNHLLVNTPKGRLHLHAETAQPWPMPEEGQIRKLVEDAVADRSDRYGSVATVEGRKITTSTGVNISLNWESLGLYQRGADTRRIDRLYKIHYLQWTGSPSLDRTLGMLGLFLLMLMTVSGVYLLFKPGAPR